MPFGRAHRGPRRWNARPVAGALVVLAAAVVTASGAAAQAAPPPSSALQIDVGTRAASRPVAPGFLGLSIEYGSALAYFGTDPAQPNPLFVALVRALDPGQAPVLRFGGDTTDWTWWPTPGVARPPGIRLSLTPAWAAMTRAMAQALDARLILGINLEADNAAIVRTESTELLNGIGVPYVAGFELGNEPEVYGTLGWYVNQKGVSVPGRPPSYDFESYLRDYAKMSAALPPSVPLVGPASGAPNWLTGLGRFLRANPRVGLATFHRYPLDRCFTPRTSATYPTLAHLLAPDAMTGPADSVQTAAAVAHARGVQFRVDELNSVACGGQPGVSDTFASALWVLGTLFNMVHVGVDGVNVHTFQKAIYEPFAFQHVGDQWTAQVRPLYYGLLMFTQAAPSGSRLLTATAPAGEPVQAWATRAPDGQIRVLLINTALHRSFTTAVATPADSRTAVEEVLRAPRVDAQEGVTLGGQSFGTTTSTGSLAGPVDDPALTAVAGRFVVRVAPASATLLTIGGA